MTRTQWLRASLPYLRSLLDLSCYPRVRIVLAALARDGVLGSHDELTPRSYLIMIDRKIRHRKALAALAHELLHVHHGVGHSHRFARAARRAKFHPPYYELNPGPALNKSLSQIAKLLGPYPSS